MVKLEVEHRFQPGDTDRARVPAAPGLVDQLDIGAEVEPARGSEAEEELEGEGETPDGEAAADMPPIESGPVDGAEGESQPDA